eukprot:31292-Pelagococcus_subviridis.AAC.2
MRLNAHRSDETATAAPRPSRRRDGYPSQLELVPQRRARRHGALAQLVPKRGGTTKSMILSSVSRKGTNAIKC